MKKAIKSAAIAALAISAITPVAASAATENVTDGIYTAEGFYSIAEFKKLSTAKKGAVLSSDNAALVVGGQALPASVILNGTDEEIDGSFISLAAYEEKYGVTFDSGKGFGEETEAGELKVESVSAITETTVTVKLTEASTKTLTVNDFKVTGAKVNSVTQGVTADVYVLNIDSLAGKQGSVTVNGVSKTYNFPAQVAKAAVENIKFDNYRQFTVTYNTVVDTATATDPANYYLEILEGNAGSKLGANPTLGNTNKLSEIANAVATWFNYTDATQTTRHNITAATVNGKTVVTINLPEKARFNGDIPSTTIELDLANAGGTKELVKDTAVNVAVRNVKDASNTRVIDTFVQPITLTDTVNPGLVRVEDMDGKVLDITKPLDIEALAENNKSKIKLVFSEPIKVTNAATDTNLLPKGVQAVLEGTTLAAGATPTAATIKGAGDTSTVKQASEIVVDLNDLVATKGGKSFTAGNSYNIKLNGFQDLADNAYLGTLNLNINLIQKDVASVTPKVLGVTQVLDNVYRVETNVANVAGVINIADADGAGTAVEVVTPLSQEYTVNKEKKYYSYVKVELNDGSVPSELSLAGANFVTKKVTVTDVKLFSGNLAASTVVSTGLDYIPTSNLKITKDQLAPTLVTPANTNLKYGATNLQIEFKDQTPFTEVQKGENADVLALQQAVLQNTTNGYAENIRVAVTYTDKVTGETVNVTHDEAVTHAALAGAKIALASNKLTIDPDKLASTMEVGGVLPEGAVFTVTLPNGLLSDSYLDTDSTETGFGQKVAHTTPVGYKALAVGTAAAAMAAVVNDDSASDRSHIDKVGRKATHGYTTGDLVLTFTVGQNTISIDDIVPQASKETISVTANNELKVKFTGAPDDSIKDLNNYLINGQSLAALGVKASDLSLNTVTGAPIGKEAIIKLPSGLITIDSPVVVTVQNVQNNKGAKMTPVSLTLNVADTTAPQFLRSSVASDTSIELFFDEQLALTTLAGATATSAAKNFKVLFGGSQITVTDVAVSGNKLTLTVGSVIDDTTALSVQTLLNANNKMEVSDVKGNLLEAGKTFVITK